ncbi:MULTISPECIES: hypothetical protein [unclassified Clostridium]|uniref:hypothetical protein n=1 Tax=unclassified Clostridium TaxID=2614128 RepID=UPI001105BC64|nr:MULTISPECIES: hypothetical protein [unclassified Clostridium]
MLEIVFICVILFPDIIIRYLPNNGFFNYWDELLFIIIFIVLIIRLTNSRIKKDALIFFLTLISIIIVGLMGNIIFGYQLSANAIIRDIVGFLKFPLTLFALCELNLTRKLASVFYRIIPFLKLIIAIIFIFGIISMFFNIGLSQLEYRHGIHPYMFLFSHPTYLTTFAMMILLALNAAKDCTLIDEIMLLGTLVLGMRTRGFIFVAIYVFVKYGRSWFKRLKVLYWYIIFCLIMAVSYNKLMLYASYSTSPRETLYMGGLKLMNICMPIGSGFGTFASHLSAKMMSGVYNTIHITGFYNENGTVSAAIGDAGYPYYMAQFGIIGLGLIIILLLFLIGLTKEGINNENTFSLNMMWLMIGISLITETILVNDGVEIAVLMAIICKLSLMTQQEQYNHRRVKIKYRIR